MTNQTVRRSYVEPLSWDYFKEESFSKECSMRLLASSFFNPSNCVLREVVDRGSIKETINRNIYLLMAAQEIESEEWSEKIVQMAAKAARIVTRTLAEQAIGAVAAPLGVIWHGLNVIRYVIVFCYDPSSRNETWNKVRIHANCFFHDLAVTFVAGWLVLSSAILSIILVSELVVPAVLVGALEQVVVATIADVFFWSFYTNLVPGHFVTSGFAIAICPENKGLLKALWLREEFGLVAQGGGLLSYNTVQDDENNDNVFVFKSENDQFWKLYCASARAMLNEIRGMQDNLPAGYKIPFHYPPERQRVVEAVEEVKTRPWLLSEEQSARLDHWLARFEKSDRTFRALDRFIPNALGTRGMADFPIDYMTALDCFLRFGYALAPPQPAA